MEKTKKIEGKISLFYTDKGIQSWLKGNGMWPGFEVSRVHVGAIPLWRKDKNHPLK